MGNGFSASHILCAKVGEISRRSGIPAETSADFYSGSCSGSYSGFYSGSADSYSDFRS